MHQKPAEPAAAAPAGVAGGEVRPARLRSLAAALGTVLALALLLVLTRELIAARVPEHRAALEQLIRDQTGLEISFSRLSVRWGWYGPEAVFNDVALGESAATPLLRARQLTVAVDAWRTVRSGHLEPGRITLIGADMDLSAQAAPGTPVARAGPLAAGPRLLSRWRGGRIDIDSGSVRLPARAGAAAVRVDVPHADLRRLGAHWSAQAQLQLAEHPDERAQLTANLTGDPAHRETLAGSLTFSSAQLTFNLWRALGVSAGLAPLVPTSGSGSLELNATVAAGAPQRIAGTLAARALEWTARVPGAQPLRLPVLRAHWQLTRSARNWQLALASLDVGSGAGEASALIVLGREGAHGSLQQLPLPALTALAQWYQPQLPLDQVALAGLVQQVKFDWNATRSPGAQLQAQADVIRLALASTSQDVRLSGLSAAVTLSDTTLTAQLDAPAADLVLIRAAPVKLAGLELHAHLSAGYDAARWYLRSDDLGIRREDGARLAARAALQVDGAQTAPHLEAQVQIADADANELAALLSGDAPGGLSQLAARVRAGRVVRAELEFSGTPGALQPMKSHGMLELADATLAGSNDWPQVEGLAARFEWQDSRVGASISAARSGALRLTSAHLSWDVLGVQALRVRAQLQGSARETLQWLRQRPQLAASTPGAAWLDLEGDTLLDVDLVVPGSGARQPAARSRITAILDGVRLHALSGVPPVEALRGTLAFSGGHLQRSSLTGQWLGGPVTLSVTERRSDAALILAARGLLQVRGALLASGVEPADAPLSGGTEWSAQLTAPVTADAQAPEWQVRADANLVGVLSHLPDPLAKSANAALPLHLEARGRGTAAQLHLSLGERLRGSAALERSGERWRLERGALRLGAETPVLPDAPVLGFEGRLGRLDLPAYLTLCQLAAASPVLPALQAHLIAAELGAGTRSFTGASVTASADRQGGTVKVSAAGLDAALSWPARIDVAHPVLVHVADFDAGRVGDLALAAGLPAALGGPVHLGVDALSWQGRALGPLSATLSAPSGALASAELQLGSAAQQLHASGQCASDGACSARFSLESADFAGMLAALGLRADLTAQRAHLTGELQWPQGSAAPLATLSGHLHMQLEDGSTRTVPEAAPAPPFALLLIPALVSGMEPETQAQPAELRFTRLTADYELEDAVASTTNLHLDGEAEILMRARVGLLTQDYDGEAFILRGEERLPSAVRRLGPTPKMAALWLSLREWFGGESGDSARRVLRLRGGWNDPIVVPAQ